MRFVDADALMETMEGHVTTMSVCSTIIEARAKGQMKQTCIADVANAPTVEAIPVEWLLKKKASCMRMSSRASQTAWLIGELIKEWQKEQEAR